MDERLALRIAFDGHRSGDTPAGQAIQAGWGSLVVTPPDEGGDLDGRAVASLRDLTAGGIGLVWDGRGTGSWVDVGRARVGALERARLHVRRAAQVGAKIVVVGCGVGARQQPVEARWDQMAGGLAELAYEAEQAGVQLALETQPSDALADLDSTDALADLDVEDRVVVDHEVTAGVQLALDHSGWLSGEAVPEGWWPSVAWIRLAAPSVGTWSASAESVTVNGRLAAETFSNAIVEVAFWGWEYEELPVPSHS